MHIRDVGNFHLKRPIFRLFKMPKYISDTRDLDPNAVQLRIHGCLKSSSENN